MLNYKKGKQLPIKSGLIIAWEELDGTFSIVNNYDEFEKGYNNRETLEMLIIKRILCPNEESLVEYCNNL